MIIVPAARHGEVIEPFCCCKVPVGGAVHVELQQQLRPFDLVAGLEPPGFEQIVRLVDIVGPVMLPVFGVVLPDLAFCGFGKRDGELAGDIIAAVQIARLAGGLEGGDQRLDRMHVGVLAAIG